MAFLIKNFIISIMVYFSPSIILKYNENNTYAVPSFINDSPVINIDKFCDVPAVFSNDTTATGSVAENIDPNIIHKFHDQFKSVQYFMNNPVA